MTTPTVKQPVKTDTTHDGLCGAKTRSGTPCRRAPAAGRTRCRLHGGATLQGIASPTFKGGRYSKYIPARLSERYHEAVADPELLAQREEIALLDGRLADLLTHVDSGEAKTLWEQARKATDKMLRAFESNDLGSMHVGILELDRLIGSGLADHEAWYEIHAVIDQRRKLAESERKRLIEMQQMVKADQAMALAGALLASVKANVTDRATLAAIQLEFNRLLAVQERVA